jgi:Entner-Doudoroff aldolase
MTTTTTPATQLEETLARVLEDRVILCIRLSDGSGLLDAARAAIRGGLSVIELTLTTPGALEVMATLASEGEALVGAGTVLTVEEVEQVKRAGGQFARAPVFDQAVVEASNRLGLLPVPGAATPREILTAHQGGARLVKVFPSAALGGPAFLKAVRGPLGHGFPLAELSGHDVLIVAGGLGICPTRSLILYILDRPHEFGRFTLFFGVRSPDDMLFRDDLSQWRCSSLVDYHETVDEPTPDWEGHVGVITSLFEQTTQLGPHTRVIICGPPVMYQFVMRQLDQLGIPSTHVFVDLERRMKCGVGKCGHCQINDRYVCLDGPVFRFSEIEHLEEAI